MAKRAQPGGTDALRKAIEETFEATAGSAAETRERAGALLDQVVTRGQETAQRIERRGAEIGSRVADAVGETIGEIQKRLKP